MCVLEFALSQSFHNSTRTLNCMTFEYMGEHPRTAPATRRRYRRKDVAHSEARLIEDTPVVAELRVAVAKGDAVISEESAAVVRQGLTLP